MRLETRPAKRPSRSGISVMSKADESRGQAAMGATARKLKWLEVVATDTALGDASVRVATVLALKYLNSRSGIAFPSQATLAADIGVTELTVRRAIVPLVDAGYLFKKRGGAGRSNRYEIELPDCENSSKPAPNKPIKSDRSENTTDRSNLIGQRSDRPINSERIDRSDLNGKTDQIRSPNPHRKPVTEPMGRTQKESVPLEGSESFAGLRDKADEPPKSNSYALAKNGE